MARRRRADADDISLFPFLSVLASIIGVLTLLISAMALAQMDNETVARAEQYEKVLKALKACEREIAELKQQVGDVEIRTADQLDEQQRELAKAQLRLQDLLQQLEQIQIQGQGPKETVKVPDYDAAAGRESIDQMQQEKKLLKEQIAQLEKELEERSKPPKESEVSILPSGSGLGFDPVFVECASESIVLHNVDPPLRIRRSDMATEEAFIKLLDRVAESEKQRVVFLVRNDGLRTYGTAGSLADAHQARRGKLPVIGQGRLDLSYFHRN
jgi:hypothetical protein